MRVMTYNIRGGLGLDGHRDTDRIADVVLAWKPDIICFQEVHQRLPWSGFINQPGLLRRRLTMPFVFQANVKAVFGGYGLGLATHYPMIAVTKRQLPGSGERRGALEVTLETPAGRLTVVDTHWGLRAEDRERQATCLGQWLSETAPPFVLCGDLNDHPETQDIQKMMRQAGLSDAGAIANEPTYPAEAPRARIDVILHSAALKLSRIVVSASQASDHRPIIADFELD
jgi:endonuclease/exonuclease/phosphatase family metal-dependent hydrolase